MRPFLACHFIALVAAVPALGTIGRPEIVVAGLLGIGGALAGLVLAGRAADSSADALGSRSSGPTSRRSAGPSSPRPGSDLPGPATRSGSRRHRDGRPPRPTRPAAARTAATVVALVVALACGAALIVPAVTGRLVDPVVLVGLLLVASSQTGAAVLARTRWWPGPTG